MIHRERDFRQKSEPARFYFDEKYKPFKRSSFKRFLSGDSGSVSHKSRLYTSNMDWMEFEFGLVELDSRYDAVRLQISGLATQLRKRNMLVRDIAGSMNQEVFTSQAQTELQNLYVDLEVPINTSGAVKLYRGFVDQDEFAGGKILFRRFLQSEAYVKPSELVFDEIHPDLLRGISIQLSRETRQQVPSVFESVVFDSLQK